MSYDLTILENGCAELGIELAQQQKDQYIQYYEYLIEKNKVMKPSRVKVSSRKFTLFFRESRRQASRCGNAIFNGIPGNPAPVPISMIVFTFVISTAFTQDRLSRKCFVNTS